MVFQSSTASSPFSQGGEPLAERHAGELRDRHRHVGLEVGRELGYDPRGGT